MESFTCALTKFFSAIADSPGCWYSIFPAPNYCFSLAGLLGITQDKLLFMFLCIGLVQNHGNLTPRLQRDTFNKFLKHHFPGGSVVMTPYRFERKLGYFIWLGQKNEGESFGTPNEALLVWAPRIQHIK